jgi:hypothetical protein
MKPFAIILVICVPHFGSWCATTSADGGRLVLAELQDNYRISVFTSPEPLRAGPVDISVLLQSADAAQIVADAQVYVKLTPREGRGQSILAHATMDAATNKMLYAAVVEIPESGWWDVDVSGTANKQPIQARFAVEAGQPLPRWLTVWPWFCWPFGVMLLFGIHRFLVARKRAQNARLCAFPLAVSSINSA